VGGSSGCTTLHWFTLCGSIADCDRLLAAHACSAHGECPSSGTTTTTDDGAARRAREAAAAAAAERDRLEEAARVERERVAEENRKKEKAARDAAFLRDRDAAAASLRGSTGTSVTPAGTALKGSSTLEPGLRGTGRDLGLLDRPKETLRDLSGPQAAWKQLHCAAYISGSALAALGKDPQEFSYLAGQASKALAGEQLGVECGAAPPMPALRGAAADWDRLRQTQQRMIDRAVTLSERIQAGQQARAKYETPAPEPARALTPDEQRIQDAYRKQKENEARIAKRDAPAIAAQEAINRGAGVKYNPKDAAAILAEQKAKAELDKYVDAAKKLENGDPSAMLNLGISLGEEAPRVRKPVPPVPRRPER
jgi:hypothetical protein